MKRFAVWVALAAALFGAERAAAEEYFQQSVRYAIHCRLDTRSHMLTGTERIVYTNNSPDTLAALYLHLYPNAFRSKQTALMKDYARRFNRTLFDLPEKHRGWLELFEVKVDDTDVTPAVDETIAEIALPHPLPPGAAAEITLRFEEKIRAHLERAGHRGGQYDLAQWYPKVAVYDEKKWRAEKLREGEYYGEFATYDVWIDVPSRYVVAATGILEEGDAGWTLNAPGKRVRGGGNDQDAEYKTVHFKAENVHDFAWNASPRFAVQDSTWNDIEIRSFFESMNDERRDSTLAQGVRAMEWLSSRVGLYPYPRMSLVECLMKGGGMEYPMLVMDGGVSEYLVFHEIAHNWFYGALSNDERAEAWLDEGLADAHTRSYLTERYGPYGSRAKWNWYQRLTPQYTLAGEARRAVASLAHRGYTERIATRSENFKHDYFTSVYEHASLMFDALRYVVGEDDFRTIIAAYFERWKFKHVNEARFQAVCEETSGKDLDWFFEEWLHTKKICDYSLSWMTTFGDDQGGYETFVRIERLGELAMPLLLRFTFVDGSQDTASVSGRLRTIEQTFSHAKKPKKAELNPDNEILDIDMTNNFLPRRRDFQIDWPRNGYRPEDATQIRHRPFAWYNDVDEARLGYHFAAGDPHSIRTAELGIYYGATSDRLDFSAALEVPSLFFGDRTRLRVSGYKLEGRDDGTIEARYTRRSRLMRPPTHEFVAGMNFHELRDARYAPDPERYQTGDDLAPYFRYTANPQFDLFGSVIDFNLRFGRDWFDAQYKYTRFETSFSLATRPLFVPVDWRFRFFWGIADHTAPYQQRFYLAGGGPLAEEKLFFLRSPGAFPADANYHAGGNGNLRGYYEGDFGVNRLIAMNLELGHTIPILSRGKKSFLGRISASAFADVGWSTDSRNPIETSERVGKLFSEGVLDKTIFDAGIGFTLARDLPFWDLFLRLDIPFYVNQPAINGETKETDFRYVFSFNSAF
jgi:hypothetical protein